MEPHTIEALENLNQGEETLRGDRDPEAQHSRISMRTSPRTKTTLQIYHKLAQSKILLHQKKPLQTSNDWFERVVIHIANSKIFD